jgi:uncharacterized protein YllA (UPF0747 family)
LRFEELPEIPREWLDFLNSKQPFFPAANEMLVLSERLRAIHHRMAKDETLRTLANVIVSDFERAPDRIQRLLQSSSVAVSAHLQAGLFGGPISQILKCLTAIRICEELSKFKIDAVPVGWLDEAVPSTFPIGSVYLIDKDSEIHCLQIGGSETTGFAPGDPLSRKQVEALLSQIADIDQGAFDMEALDMIREAFVPETTLSSASANLLTALMKEWGMIVLNAATPAVQSILTRARATIRGQTANYDSPLAVQSLMMPVIACVIDPSEIQACEQMLPFFDEYGLPKPIVWPQCSATILDARSRRILERFKLNLNQLYSGEKEIAGKIRNGMPRSAFEKLISLKSEAAMRMGKMQSLGFPGSEFAKTAGACTEKIVYQLQKLLDNCMDARKRQEQVMIRQIHKLCNSLAPNGRMQERELGGIQIPLRYSCAGLRSLYEKLDIMKFEHQLISMD